MSGVEPMGTLVEVAESIRRRDRSASEVMEDCIERIEAGNAALTAFVYQDFDRARREAAQLDKAIARGEDPGPLAGVPFGVKDLENCQGMPTSHGSLLYKDLAPVEEDSIHVARLRAAGAIAVGKTAAPEFGTLHFTRSKAWGVTRNPWNLAKTPGGSSGGSAAAVSAGLVPFATASDGGGSTRIPGAYRGLVGMKPSFGRIPGPYQDDSLTWVRGAMVTTVGDAARHLDVTCGPDGRDKISLPAPGVMYEEVIEAFDVSGLRVAWTGDMGHAAVDPEVEKIAGEAARALIGGARLSERDVRVNLPDAMRVWMSVGAMTLWLGIDRREHWPQRAHELTPFVRDALEATDTRPLPTLDGAYRRRWQLEDAVARLFDEVDVLLCPTTATPAFDAGGPTQEESDARGVPRGAEVPFTMLANICWNPACSVPAGLSAEGLPVGLQIIGRQHCDDVVLRLARIFEQLQPWPRHAPSAGSR